MKIAIVWKWWSGKSTISSLLISYFYHTKKSFWAIDADTNMHLGLNFDIQYDDNKALSLYQNKTNIKQYLIWKNSLIKSPKYMVKTTPPSKWSKIFTNTNDNFMKKYSVWQIGNWDLFFVWWYTSEWAWLSCYHTSLVILENILSHIDFGTDEYCIVDMVASTDAFSNSLHLQFDKMLLITEASRESVDLTKKYLELAKATGVENLVQIFGNKIADDEDIDFIKRELHIQDFPYLPIDQDLKKHLRNGMSILSYFQDKSWYLSDIFSWIWDIHKIPLKTKLQKLSKLHLKYIELDYIKTPLWDLTSQIDENFINNL